MEASHIAQLKDLIELQPADRLIVVDLNEVKLADRDAVIFLGDCEAAGVTLLNCPAFIREWIARETAERDGGRTDD